jgi:hypothetical protein
VLLSDRHDGLVRTEWNIHGRRCRPRFSIACGTVARWSTPNLTYELNFIDQNTYECKRDSRSRHPIGNKRSALPEMATTGSGLKESGTREREGDL